MLGIFSALGAATSWTYACFLWRQQTQYFTASKLNLIKNILAFIIFLPILFTLNFQNNTTEVLLLLISGVIGIALGDSFYIMALRIIGTRKTLTIEAISPIIATFLGAIFLREMLSFKLYFGVFIVSISLLGIAFEGRKENISSISLKKGYCFALLSVIFAVLAATLSRLVLTNSSLSIFQTTEIRLAGGIIALIPFNRSNLINSIKSLPLKKKKKLLYATFLGTNVGILLQQNVFKLLPIGLGWTLLSTSPVIALFFAQSEGERITWKTIFFTITTILGIAVAFI